MPKLLKPAPRTPSSRVLSAYEKNQLRRYGFDPESTDQYGERPAEYITGKTTFLGQELMVSPAILIPRPETEELVELVQQDFLNKADWPSSKTLQIGDIGTGSGAIGLSLLRFFEEQQQPAVVTLVDVSAEALNVARENFNQLFNDRSLFGSVEFIQSDLLAGLPKGQRFDYLVANLPYIPSGRITQLASSVKDFEPLAALDGGEDGLRLIAQLLDQSKTRLTSSGKIYLELNDTHTQEKIQAIAMGYQAKVFLDQFGKNRFAVLEIT